MDFINYAALDLKKTKQFGSDKRVASNQEIGDFDYTDGLSNKELEKIDKNKDGAISENEFKAAFGGNSANAYKSYWDSYKSFYNATSKTTSTGSKSTVVKDDGTVVTSNYDKNGNLESYTEAKVDDLGVKNSVKYKYVNGKEVAIQQTAAYSDGTSQVKNLETGAFTNKNADGSSVTYDKNGRLSKIKTDAFGTTETYSLNYSDAGKLTSANVNGKKYTNITQKDNTTTIKDDKGNVVAKLTADGSGNTYFTEYEKGKKAKQVKMDSDGMAEYVVKYDKNGKSESKMFCENNQLRKYERDASGKLVKSVDTRDGKLYSEQTYSDKTQKDIYGDTRPASTLWETRTFYDENGNVKSYLEYDYQAKDKNGNVIKTTDYYGADKKSKQKSVVTTLDEYTNKVSAITYNSKNVESSRTYYEYDVERDVELTDNHLKTKTTEKDSSTIVENYEHNTLVDKTVVNIENGVASTSSYSYKYHNNGQIKEVEEESENGSKKVTEYDEQGNVTSEKIDVTSLLIAQYPNLTNAQISQLARRCVRINDLANTQSLVDYTNGKFNIKIPEFEIGEDDNLNFK